MYLLLGGLYLLCSENLGDMMESILPSRECKSESNELVGKALSKVTDLKPKLLENSVSDSDVTEFFDAVNTKIMNFILNALEKDEYPKKCDSTEFTNLLLTNMKQTHTECLELGCPYKKHEIKALLERICKAEKITGTHWKGPLRRDAKILKKSG